MKVNTHLRHITHLRGLEAQIETWAENYFNLGNVEKLHLDVYMAKESPRSELHGPIFECHITAKAPWLHKTVFAKISDEDFWAAFTDCCARVYQQLEKDVDRHTVRSHEEIYDKAY